MSNTKLVQKAYQIWRRHKNRNIPCLFMFREGRRRFICEVQRNMHLAVFSATFIGGKENLSEEG